MSPTPDNRLSILFVVVAIVPLERGETMLNLITKILERAEYEDEGTSPVCPDRRIEDDQKGGGLL